MINNGHFKQTYNIEVAGVADIESFRTGCAAIC